MDFNEAIEALGCNPGALQRLPRKVAKAIVTAAYRAIQKETHPDAQGGATTLAHISNRVSQAYALLDNEETFAQWHGKKLKQKKRKDTAQEEKEALGTLIGDLVRSFGATLLAQQEQVPTIWNLERFWLQLLPVLSEVRAHHTIVQLRLVRTNGVLSWKELVWSRPHKPGKDEHDREQPSAIKDTLVFGCLPFYIVNHFGTVRNMLQSEPQIALGLTDTGDPAQVDSYGLAVPQPLEGWILSQCSPMLQRDAHLVTSDGRNLFVRGKIQIIEPSRQP